MAMILIVEDNVHQRHLLSLWLRRNGHEVVEASNGREAQTLLSGVNGPPPAIDLIISDVNMPDMDGVELVRWVRDCLPATLPVFVLSSRCNQAELDQSLAGCGARVIPKPFSPSRLVGEIEKVLAAAGT
jgi:two-component system, chemotaxis family, chemotaxis protein CheY